MIKAMQVLSLCEQTRKLMVVEAEPPVPQPGEVLVEVMSSAVNEMDVQIRAGQWGEYVDKYRQRGSAVSGFEFSGVARSTGEWVKPGQRVIGYVDVLQGPRTHAQFVAVSEACLHPIPDNMSFGAAASLVSMGLTAIEILEVLRPLKASDRILIVGAAGGVGIYTLQLAKAQGAHITAVCSQKNVAWIQDVGADEARAYEDDGPFRKGDAFDLIVDCPCALSFAKSEPYLTEHGTYVCTNPYADLDGFKLAKGSSRQAGWLLMLTTNQDKLRRLLDLAASGVLSPVVDSDFALADAERAFDRFATRGKQGRVLLRFAE